MAKTAEIRNGKVRVYRIKTYMDLCAEITRREGGKQTLNIGQVIEVLGHFGEILGEHFAQGDHQRIIDLFMRNARRRHARKINRTLKTKNRKGKK